MKQNENKRDPLILKSWCLMIVCPFQTITNKDRETIERMYGERFHGVDPSKTLDRLQADANYVSKMIEY